MSKLYILPCTIVQCVFNYISYNVYIIILLYNVYVIYGLLYNYIPRRGDS